MNCSSPRVEDPSSDSGAPDRTHGECARRGNWVGVRSGIDERTAVAPRCWRQLEKQPAEASNFSPAPQRDSSGSLTATTVVTV